MFSLDIDQNQKDTSSFNQSKRRSMSDSQDVKGTVDRTKNDLSSPPSTKDRLSQLPLDVLSHLSKNLSAREFARLHETSKTPAIGQVKSLQLDRLPTDENLDLLARQYPNLEVLVCNCSVSAKQALLILDFCCKLRKLTVLHLIEVMDLPLRHTHILKLHTKAMELHANFNKPIVAGVWPWSLKSLTFGHNFDQAIAVGVLPESLKSLTFGRSFNQAIAAGVLPGSLKSLTFGVWFNQPIAAKVLPGSLTSLTFVGWFNQPIAVGVLPGSLKSLTLGRNFNQAIAVGVLPGSLTSLTFGEWFDQPIAVGVLPGSLTSLTFGNWFNQSINNGVLPESLRTLIFSNRYRVSIDARNLPALVKVTIAF